MKIDVYVMIHNEEFMLPYFLRHYGKYADRIFAFEDQSTDRSREILEAEPKVTILEVWEHGINEPHWINDLWPKYEHYSRGVADWVIQVDCDEFVYHPDLIGLLQREREKGVQVLTTEGYTMVANGIPTTDGQIYEEFKMGLPDRLSGKSCVFDPMIYLRFAPGRHSIKGLTDYTLRNYHSGLKLLHYRYLGEEYFEERDRRNHARGILVSGKNTPYSRDIRHMQPDRTRGVRLDWFAQHKSEAENVVDYGYS